MKFTDEQKELIALLPKEVRGDKDLTDSAKLVLGDLILWWGIDFAADNGYIFRTNEDIMKDTGLGSNNTIINAIRQLKQKGLISTKRGKRHSASEYILDEKLHDKKCTIQTQKCTSKLHDNTQSALLNNDKLIEDMQLTINDLVKRIETLEEEIALLKTQKCTSKNCSNEIKKCTTDTDTETDKEKESGIREQGNEIEHEWNDEPIDFEYNDELKRIGLNEVGNAEGKCQDQAQDNFNDISKKKPNGNTNTTSYANKNKWVTWYFDEMNSNLNALANSKTKVTIEGLQDKIAELLQIGLDKQDDFTDKQWSVVQNFADRFIKLMEIKQQYLKGNKNTDSVQAPNNSASDVYSDDEWTTKVEQSFNSEETTKDNSSDKPQRIDSTSKNEVNEKFTRLVGDIKDLNDAYSAATTKEAIDGYYQKSLNLTSKFNEMADKLSDAQLAYGQSLLEKTVDICGRKDNYLAAITKNNKTTDIVQTHINQASEESTKDNSSDSSKEEMKPQKSEEEELNDHMLKMFNELDEQDKTLESKVQSTLTWDTLPF